MSTIESRAHRRLGTTLRGRYRLDALLAVDDVASVYKATHCDDSELMVKMLHPELSRRDDVRYRFLRDGYAANSVRHPGVVLVVDDDIDDDGNAFVVTELVEGEDCATLRARLGGHLPMLQACTITHEVLDVLAMAHGKGFFHRHIDLASIVVARSGETKLLDFGIARVRDVATSSRPPAEPSARADAAHDLWSVSCALFTMLTGEPLPRGSLASILPEAPEALVHFLDRALSPEPEARWRSAVGMREALATVMATFH